MHRNDCQKFTERTCYGVSGHSLPTKQCKCSTSNIGNCLFLLIILKYYENSKMKILQQTYLYI